MHLRNHENIKKMKDKNFTLGGFVQEVFVLVGFIQGVFVGGIYVQGIFVLEPSVNTLLVWGEEAPSSNSGICAQTTMELGRVRLWGENYAKQQKELVTSSPLSNYNVISYFDLVVTTKHATYL